MNGLNLTAFQIYKKIVKQLGLLFPYKEKEITVRKNPIPNNLEFHLKNISNKELNDNMNIISSTYYKIFLYIGENKFYELHDVNDVFKYTVKEYPDRFINLSTVLSILFLSGFQGDELYDRALAYLQTCGGVNKDEK